MGALAKALGSYQNMAHRAALGAAMRGEGKNDLARQSRQQAATPAGRAAVTTTLRAYKDTGIQCESLVAWPGAQPRAARGRKAESWLSYSLRGSSPRPMAHKTIALTTELRELE